MLEPSLLPSSQLHHWIANEASALRAVHGRGPDTSTICCFESHSAPAVQMDCLVFPPPPPRSLAKRTPAECRRLAISNQPMFIVRSYAYDRDDHADPRAA